MTELLQQVILEIQKLPAEQQDAIALRLMAELKDEQRWAEQFEATTDDQWDQLADMVRQEIAGGDTVSLDAVFPAKSWSRVSQNHFVNASIDFPHPCKNRLTRLMNCGAKTLITTVCSSSESVNASQFTLLVSALIIERWGCLSQMIKFFGFGLGHMISTMSY